MHEVLYTDTTKPEVLPYLSAAKHGYALKKERTHNVVKEK